MFCFLALMAILLGGTKLFGYFCYRPYEEHLGEIILNLGQPFRRRCPFFFFLALMAILLGEADILGNSV